MSLIDLKKLMDEIKEKSIQLKEDMANLLPDQLKEKSIDLYYRLRNDAYYPIEDYWFRAIDFLNRKGVPSYKAIDPLERRGIPSLPVYITAVIAILLLVFIGMAPTIVETDLSVRVYDDSNDMLIEGAEVSLYLDGERITTSITDGEGRAYLKAETGKNYRLEAQREHCEGLGPHRETLTIQEEPSERTLTLSCDIEVHGNEVELCFEPEGVGEIRYMERENSRITHYNGECGSSSGGCAALILDEKEYRFHSDTMISEEWYSSEELEEMDPDENECIQMKHKDDEPPRYGDIVVEVKDKHTEQLLPNVGVQLTFPHNESASITRVQQTSSISRMLGRTYFRGELYWNQEFQVKLLAGENSGYKLSEKTYRAPEGGLEHVTVEAPTTFDPEIEKTNIKVEDDGEPLEGATVNIMDGETLISKDLNTDENGETTAALKTDKNYRAVAHKPGYREATSSITGGETQTLTLEQAQEEKTSDISITIKADPEKMDPRGESGRTPKKPGTGEARARIARDKETPVSEPVPTNSDGEVEFKDVPEGEYCLRFVWENTFYNCPEDRSFEFTKPVEHEPEQWNRYFEPPRYELQVNVEHEGNAVEDAEVKVNWPQGNPDADITYEKIVNTDEDGKANFTGLDAIVYNDEIELWMEKEEENLHSGKEKLKMYRKKTRTLEAFEKKEPGEDPGVDLIRIDEAREGGKENVEEIRTGRVYEARFQVDTHGPMEGEQWEQITFRLNHSPEIEVFPPDLDTLQEERKEINGKEQLELTTTYLPPEQEQPEIIPIAFIANPNLGGETEKFEYSAEWEHEETTAKDSGTRELNVVIGDLIEDWLHVKREIKIDNEWQEVQQEFRDEEGTPIETQPGETEIRYNITIPEPLPTEEGKFDGTITLYIANGTFIESTVEREDVEIEENLEENGSIKADYKNNPLEMGESTVIRVNTKPTTEPPGVIVFGMAEIDSEIMEQEELYLGAIVYMPYLFQDIQAELGQNFLTLTELDNQLILNLYEEEKQGENKSLKPLSKDETEEIMNIISLGGEGLQCKEEATISLSKWREQGHVKIEEGSITVNFTDNCHLSKGFNFTEDGEIPDEHPKLKITGDAGGQILEEQIPVAKSIWTSIPRSIKSEIEDDKDLKPATFITIPRMKGVIEIEPSYQETQIEDYQDLTNLTEEIIDLNKSDYIPEVHEHSDEIYWPRPLPYLNVTDADVETNITIQTPEEDKDIEIKKENENTITFNYTGEKLGGIREKEFNITIEAWNTEKPGIRKEETIEAKIEVHNETMPGWGFFVPIPLQTYEEDEIGEPICATNFCNLDQLLEYTLDIADRLEVNEEMKNITGNLVLIEPGQSEIMNTLEEMGTQRLSQYPTNQWLKGPNLINTDWTTAKQEIQQASQDHTAIHMPEGKLPKPGINNITISKGRMKSEDGYLVEYYNITYEHIEETEGEEPYPSHYNSPWYYRLHAPMQKTPEMEEKTRTPIYVDETIEENQDTYSNPVKNAIEEMWNKETVTEITEEEFEDYDHGIKIGLCPENNSEHENCEKLSRRTKGTNAIFRDNQTGHLNIIARDKGNLTKLVEQFEEAFGKGNPWALQIRVPVSIQIAENVTVSIRENETMETAGYLTLPPKTIKYYEWDDTADTDNWVGGTIQNKIKEITETRMNVTDLEDPERSDDPYGTDVFWIMMKCRNEELNQCGEDIEDKSTIIDRYYKVFGEGSGIPLPEHGVFFSPLPTTEEEGDIEGIMEEEEPLLTIGGPNIILIPEDRDTSDVSELLKEYERLMEDGDIN